MPVLIEITITPKAREAVEIRAMAASGSRKLLSFRRRSRKAARMTTGREMAKGAVWSIVAAASVPNPTWESPSPIMA